MKQESIDEVLGRDYVLVNAIEGDNAEIDDASIDRDGSSRTNLDGTQETIDLTLDDDSDDGDESPVLNLRATNEAVDLTLEDTDDETEENIGHYTCKLRSNFNRLKKRKAKSSNAHDEEFCLAKKAHTMSSVAAVQRRAESHSQSSTSDSCSVTSRFSANYSDEEEESPVSAEQPAQKTLKNKKRRTTNKTPRGKGKNSRPKRCNRRESTLTHKTPPAKGKKTKAKTSHDLQILSVHQQLNFPIVREELKDVYYAMIFFGDKMLVDKKQYSPKQEKSPVDNETIVNGMKYQLFFSKFVTRKGKSYNFEDSMSQKYYKSFYIGVSDGNGATLNLAEQLLRIADFESLAYDEGPEKVIARLSLLVSPACKSPDSRRVPLVHRLTNDMFKVIEDNGHEGCGFIPKPLLTALLGDSKRAKASTAIQVRVFSPTGFGIGKGMLMVKDDIDRIEIPTSMVKVKKSTAKDPLHDDVVLIVSGIYPSVPANVIGKIIDPDDKPTASQLKDLEPPSEMFQNVMLAKGVTRELLDGYISNFNDDKTNGTKHASLVGVADPTDSIPLGCVFLTGMSNPPARVFLTRSPCTEASDGIVVNVCNKGDFLSNDYDFLSNLPFGTVIFPLGNPSLPSTINSSDLDGDKFFALWDEAIVDEAGHNDDKGLADDFVIHYDDFVGTTFRHNGYDAIIIGKERYGERYLVDVQSPTQTTIFLSRIEIMSGRGYMSRVIGHSLKKGKTEFHIEWEDKSREKHLSTDLKREYSTPPEVLLEYVRKNKLAKNMRDCKWFEAHLGQAILVKIIGHRGVGKDIEVRCEYDDNDKSWESLNDHLIDSKLLVGKYVKENSLENQDGWQQAYSLWLQEIQECLILQREYEVGLLISRTFQLWKKACSEFGANSADSLIWGRAYKDANELKKHGGRVTLPLMYYQQLVGKQGKNCKFLLLLEPIYGYVGPSLSSEHGYEHPNTDENKHISMGYMADDSGWTRMHSAINNHQEGKWMANDDSGPGWNRSLSVLATKMDDGQGWGRKTTGKDSSTAVSFSNHVQAYDSNVRPTVPSAGSNSNELSASPAGRGLGSGWGRSDISTTMKNDDLTGKKSTCKDSSTAVSMSVCNDDDSLGCEQNVPISATNSIELSTSPIAKDCDRGWDKSSEVSITMGDGHVWGRKTTIKDSSAKVLNESDSSGWGHSIPAATGQSNRVPCSTPGTECGSDLGKNSDVSSMMKDDGLGWGRNIQNKDSSGVMLPNKRSAANSSGAESNLDDLSSSTIGSDTGLGWDRSSDMLVTNKDDGQIRGRNFMNNPSSAVMSVIIQRDAPPTAASNSNDLLTSIVGKDSVQDMGRSPEVSTAKKDDGWGRGKKIHVMASSGVVSVNNRNGGDSAGCEQSLSAGGDDANESFTSAVGIDSGSGGDTSSVAPTAVKDDETVWGRKNANKDSSIAVSISNCSEVGSSGCEQTVPTAGDLSAGTIDKDSSWGSGKSSYVSTEKEGNCQVWGRKAACTDPYDADSSGWGSSVPSGKFNPMALSTSTVGEDFSSGQDRPSIVPVVDGDCADQDLNASLTNKDVIWSPSARADTYDHISVGSLNEGLS
ncbi:hypothetical protein ACHAWX_007736 [Stephanocyclus meneghinianus]